MDALLQIIVPEIKKINGLEIAQPVYEWDGIEYPQGPKILSWQDVSLSFDEKSAYFNIFLPSNYYDEGWTWLKVSNETLNNYEISVNSENETNNAKGLETFLRTFLANYEKWIVAFLLHYDQIDNVYQLDLESCITKFKDNLTQDIKEGFIAYK